MRIAVHAVGRLKNGPERELADRYLDRFAKVGPQVGLEFGGVTETAESRSRSAIERKREEAAALAARVGQGTAVILLDERGKQLTSEQFAALLASMRDAGRRELVIAIGGADGHDRAMHGSAEAVVGLGAMTWPHQMVRILLAEQLYRAVTILSGHPYHRA